MLERFELFCCKIIQYPQNFPNILSLNFCLILKPEGSETFLKVVLIIFATIVVVGKNMIERMINIINKNCL